MADKVRRVLLPAAFWLGVWWLCALLIGKELILPSPWAVAAGLAGLLGEGSFWWSMACSLGRVWCGFLLGTVLGTVLGMVTTLRWGELLLSPALRAVRTVPVVSFILLLYFALPTGQIPVAVSALMALPVVWRASRQGMEAADPALLELADHYRLGVWRTFRTVRLPAALPALRAGWETALGLAWKAGVAAEVLCQPEWAAGSGLQAAKATLDTAGVAAWTVAIVAVSLGMEGLFRLSLRRWRGGGEA